MIDKVAKKNIKYIESPPTMLFATNIYVFMLFQPNPPKHTDPNAYGKYMTCQKGLETWNTIKYIYYISLVSEGSDKLKTSSIRTFQ